MEKVLGRKAVVEMKNPGENKCTNRRNRATPGLLGGSAIRLVEIVASPPPPMSIAFPVSGVTLARRRDPCRCLLAALELMISK
ncbi:hypothetical protein RvY_13032 [Ramazzottius varieornatus]|uniref:Uncharacterized protein n=1 Tax=Ramazzottius varieornatus TaxID=947166 RepID=A0A1D1VLI6_RAMVA|nr:hypothetical protein RvY_13032 [Ramazzottius varieornatus]